MACKIFIFPIPLTFDSVLHIFTIVFAFLEFTKLLLMVVRYITFFITLHIMINQNIGDDLLK
jgi:hypothetical protein